MHDGRVMQPIAVVLRFEPIDLLFWNFVRGANRVNHCLFQARTSPTHLNPVYAGPAGETKNAFDRGHTNFDALGHEFGKPLSQLH